MGALEDLGLGDYTGGFADRFNWNSATHECWDEYSEETLFQLYKDLLNQN